MKDWEKIAPITHAETERAGRRFVWQLAGFLVCIPLAMIAMRVWVAPIIESKTGPAVGSPFGSGAGLNALAGPGIGKAKPDAEAKTVALFVHGMECAMCAVQVEEALGKVPGVESVKADFETGRTEITCRTADTAAISAAIAEAISKTKYTIGEGPQTPPSEQPTEPGAGVEPDAGAVGTPAAPK